MAREIVTPRVEAPPAPDGGVETALFYVEAALEAHRGSVSEEVEVNRKLQWAVTGLLERALQILDKNVYGER